MVSPRPGDRRDAEEMVARRAGLQPARAGQIGGEHAAERAVFPAVAAEQRPVIHRLEGKLLVVVVEQLLDLGERRPGLGRQHQLLRLVERRRRRGPDRSSVMSVWLGRPMPRLVPAPTTSSALSLASAQRTASSASLPSRGLSVSVIAIPQPAPWRAEGRHQLAREAAELLDAALHVEHDVVRRRRCGARRVDRRSGRRAVKRMLFGRARPLSA